MREKFKFTKKSRDSSEFVIVKTIKQHIAMSQNRFFRNKVACLK